MLRQIALVLLLFCDDAPRANARDIPCLKPTSAIRSATQFVEERMEVRLSSICIRRVSRARLSSIVQAKSRVPAGERELEAAFEPRSKGIFLSETLDLSSPVDLSFLVHELVHAAQFEQSTSGSEQPIGYLEYEAYSLQASFLKSRGFDQEALLYKLLGLLQATSASDYRYEPDRE